MLAALARLELRLLRSLDYSSKKERHGPSFATPSRVTRWLGSVLVVNPQAQSGDLLYGTVPTLRYSAVSQFQGCEPIQLTGLRSLRRQREEQGLTSSGRLAWRKVLELVKSVEPCSHRIDYPATRVFSTRSTGGLFDREGDTTCAWCLEMSLILGCHSLSEVKVFGREQNALSETNLIRIVLILVPISENIICKAAYDRERRRPERLNLAVYSTLPCLNRGRSEKSVGLRKVERPIVREASLCRNP